LPEWSGRERLSCAVKSSSFRTVLSNGERLGDMPGDDQLILGLPMGNDDRIQPYTSRRLNSDVSVLASSIQRKYPLYIFQIVVVPLDQDVLVVVRESKRKVQGHCLQEQEVFEAENSDRMVRSRDRGKPVEWRR